MCVTCVCDVCVCVCDVCVTCVMRVCVLRTCRHPEGKDVDDPVRTAVLREGAGCYSHPVVPHCRRLPGSGTLTPK